MHKSEAEGKTHLLSKAEDKKEQQASFSQMVEVVCYCQWHRMFFLKSDFMEQMNQKEIHSVLDKHAKNDHPFKMPVFSVRTANLENNKFEMTPEY